MGKIFLVPLQNLLLKSLADLLAYFVLAQWSAAVSQSFIIVLLEIGLFMIITVTRHE
jgi:hypothetical protein